MELLFEIGMEEIPARFLNQALEDLKNNFEKKLKNNRIKFSGVRTYGTPRRLVLVADEVAEMQEDLDELNIGPSRERAYKDGALTKAGEGFLKAHRIEEEQIEIIKNDKGEYIAFKRFSKGKPTETILPEILKALVLEETFQKSMRWSDKTIRFARPIEWFLALYGGKVLDFEIEGIKSSNKSKGHRFFGKEFEVSSVEDYLKKIKENNVIIDISERRKMIEEMISKSLLEDEKADVDEGLLDEVTNLVEYPFAIVGNFSEEFLEVPQEVLIISMKVHQRYFPILDKKGKLLPKFIVIRNGIDFSQNVKEGNEKVLSARLADARFFYQEDLKIPLDQNVEKLKTVVFQKDLGTMFNKVKRTEKIAEFLIGKLKYNYMKADILRTVKLAKADLVSNMIGEKEFTKLQGLMGSKYAMERGEEIGVAIGIKEHYYPRFQGDLLPSGIEGIITGLSDRIDTLVGCFGVGLIPTGSKDPFALRRTALGIVNIIINANINISLKELVNVSLDALQADQVLKGDRAKVEADVLDFLKQRMINVFTDMKYRKDIVLAVLDRDADNITNALEIVKVISEKLALNKLEALLQVAKRVTNIITKGNNNVTVKEKLFKDEIEKTLFAEAKIIAEEAEKSIKENEYADYFEKIISLVPTIDKYFETVIVMDEDKNIRENRINQLTFIKNLFDRIAYLNKID